jgi:hypothetical protein
MRKGMLGAAAAAVREFLRQRFDLNVSSQSGFQALVDRQARLERELDDARNMQRMHEARAQWLAGALQETIGRHFRSLQSAVRTRQSTDVKRTILIVMTSAAQMTQLKALTAAPRLRGDYEFVVVAYLDAQRYGLVAFCEQNGVSLLSYDLKVLAGDMPYTGDAKPDSFSRTLEQNLASVIETIEERRRIEELGALASEVRRQMAIYVGAGRVLRDLDVSLVVLFEDNAEYETGIWTSVAQENLISTMIIPYTIADAIEPAEGHHHDPAFWAGNGIHNRLAKAAMPHWLYHYKDRWLLRRGGVSAVAAEAIGVASDMPWVHNGSKADAIAVEGEAMRRHYISQGIPESQLRLTGSLTDDLLAATAHEQDKLKAELGLDRGKRVLLCSVPNNQFDPKRPECEFADFAAMADFWMAELAAVKDWHVLVKPHPSLPAEDVAYLRKFGLPVLTDYDTTSLIPLCDVYNTCVSSTIRWALACGKPVLNYDVYKYRYQDFVAEPAVITVADATGFSRSLQRLTGDRQVLAEHTALAEAAANRWGLLDGNSTNRIADLLDELADRRSGRLSTGH